MVKAWTTEIRCPTNLLKKLCLGQKLISRW